MNQKEQYQRLQLLVRALQLEEWPLETNRRDAKIFVEQFTQIKEIKEAAKSLNLTLDKDDPNFLPFLERIISYLLAQLPEQPAPNIPPNLAKLVEDYERYLAKKREEREKLSSSQKILQDQIKNQLQNRFKSLEQNPELAQEISHHLSNRVADRLPLFAIEAVFKKEDYRITLKEIEPEINRELEQAGILTEPATIEVISDSLIKTTFEQARDLAARPREKVVKREVAPAITPEEGVVTQAEEELERKIGDELPRLGILPYTPREHQELSRAAKDIIIAHLLELPEEEITQERYESLLRKIWPRIREKLEAKGFSFSQTQAENLIKEFVQKSQGEATILTTTAPRLPKEVETRLAARVDAPAYWFQFSRWRAYLTRAIFGPPKKALEIAVDEVVPEEKKIWEEMIKKGLFAEDLQASIDALKEAKLPETHPAFGKLAEKRERFSVVQKRAPLATWVLQHYYGPLKRAGQQQIYEPETRMYLPRLSPLPISGHLQEFLNKIGLATRLYQKIKLGPGKTVIRPYLSEKFMRFITGHRYSSVSHLLSTIHQKTLGRILAALGRTVAGKAVKAGIKKVAIWIATKLGVKVLAAAIAAAGGPPGWVISAILLVAEKVIKFVWDKLLKPILSKIIQFIKEPDKAFMAVVAGAAVVVFLPMPIALIGIVPITLGGLGLVSWGISSAGAIAGGFAAKVAAFFLILTTAPFTAPIALLFIGIISVLAAFTFFIVITTAGAFILPVVPTPFRYISPFPPTAIEPECVDLIDLIGDTADDHCVPPAIMMAISRMEASGVWGWSCKEVDYFSTPRWWEGATQTVKDRGYCYDTCAKTGLCSGTTVVGPMQFEENTWRGVMPGYDLWDRCRLDLSLIAAAKKIKANSGTGPGNCGPWDEATVRYVAYRYCGSCGTYGCQLNPDPNDTCSPACGYDYCSNVWYLYQQYESR